MFSRDVCETEIENIRNRMLSEKWKNTRVKYESILISSYNDMVKKLILSQTEIVSKFLAIIFKQMVRAYKKISKFIIL